MARWVARSPAADPSAAWTISSPEQQFFNSAGLGVTLLVMLVYAFSGVVFGHLPLFMLEFFVELNGLSAWLAAAATVALALGWATHLVQRHHLAATAEVCRWFRRMGYMGAAAFAFLTLLVEVSGQQTMLNWRGLAPASEWLFAPLPWLWRDLLPLSSDKVTGRIFMVGGAAFALSLLCLKVFKWPRAFMLFMGLAVCTVGVYLLGDAAFDFGASRGLPGASPVFVTEMKANPGRTNAWNFLSWLGALACVAYGTVFVAAACVILPKDLKALTTR